MKKESENTVSRRNFAKSAGAAGFAVLSASHAKAAVNGDTLKVGLLGCGSRGSGAARQMLEGNENVQLVALADLFPDKVADKRKMYDELGKSGNIKGTVNLQDDHCFVGWDAYKKILDTDIDIIIEGTLPYSRPKHVEAAVNAKKHIFTEKPVASDAAGIRQFMAAVQKHKDMGLSLCAGTQRRHQAGYRAAIQRIRDGKIGDINSLVAYWDGGLPFVHERQPGWSDAEYRIRNWYAYCWVAGDSIVEQHVHNLDVCNWVMGDEHPVSVLGTGGRNWKPNTEKYGDIFDHFSCDYVYGNGVHLHSYCRHWDGCDGQVSEEAVGSKGREKFNSKADRDLDVVNPYVQEHIDLVNSIRGTGPYFHEGMQVANSTMTAIMGRMSAYSGKRLTWEEALAGPSIVPDPLNFDVSVPVGPVPQAVDPKRIK